VDVYGSREGQGKHWVGVQCKLKGDTKRVTRAELENEIAEAKKFKPALADFIVVTTALMTLKYRRLHVRSLRNMPKRAFSRSAYGDGRLSKGKLRTTRRRYEHFTQTLPLFLEN
jgi:hypothetical protein